jgi:hypothetical protein
MRACFALLVVVAAASPAGAACREDLIKADQNFNRTRSELQQAATAAPAVKCGAFRRHVASLTEVRNVFARCDTGSAKAANASQVNASLVAFSKQMRENCGGVGKK